MFSKVNAASAFFMSQAKGHHPPSYAHGPSVEPSAVVPSALTTPLVDPAGAAVGVKPDIPLGTCHAPQTSPRSPSKRGLGRRSVKADKVIEGTASGFLRRGGVGSSSRTSSARLQARQQQQVTITAMPGFVQRRSQRQATKKRAEGDQHD